MGLSRMGRSRGKYRLCHDLKKIVIDKKISSVVEVCLLLSLQKNIGLAKKLIWMFPLRCVKEKNKNFLANPI